MKVPEAVQAKLLVAESVGWLIKEWKAGRASIMAGVLNGRSGFRAVYAIDWSSDARGLGYAGLKT
jgi:hypothetical protein